MLQSFIGSIVVRMQNQLKSHYAQPPEPRYRPGVRYLRRFFACCLALHWSLVAYIQFPPISLTDWAASMRGKSLAYASSAGDMVGAGTGGTIGWAACCTASQSPTYLERLATQNLLLVERWLTSSVQQSLTSSFPPSTSPSPRPPKHYWSWCMIRLRRKRRQPQPQHHD